jgi:hypothetical protein
MMSAINSTENPDTSDEAAIAGAVSLLAKAAQRDFASVKTQLKAAGFLCENLSLAPLLKTEPEILGPFQIGQLIAGKGVFMGPWQPKARNSRSLDKSFNVFAAPEDLTDASGRKLLLTFRGAARQVASLRNWHGHDGGTFENDAALYKALEYNSYKGEWFIPPRDLLIGTDVDGNGVANESLYHNKDKGALNGTFTSTASGSDYGHWYWSSTERRDGSSDVWTVKFSDGVVDWSLKYGLRLSCRPCRVEALTL